jgi:hypothetical protein
MYEDPKMLRVLQFEIITICIRCTEEPTVQMATMTDVNIDNMDWEVRKMCESLWPRPAFTPGYVNPSYYEGPGQDFFG